MSALGQNRPFQFPQAPQPHSLVFHVIETDGNSAGNRDAIWYRKPFISAHQVAAQTRFWARISRERRSPGMSALGRKRPFSPG